MTVTATPATGYHFVNWTENGTEVSTEATFTFNATVDRNLIAIFAKNEDPDPTPTPTPDPEPSGPSTGDSTGWDDILDELENTAKGDEITIDMGDETKSRQKSLKPSPGRTSRWKLLSRAASPGR